MDVQSRPSPAPAPETAPASSTAPWREPWVRLRTFSYHPTIYPAMIGEVSRDIRPGAWVDVYDKNGRMFGNGLFHPTARVPLRMVHHGDAPTTDALLHQLLDRAIDLRLGPLGLPGTTDAFRVVHSDGDGLGGLIVDKFGDVLSVQVHSLGIWQRLKPMLSRFTKIFSAAR